MLYIDRIPSILVVLRMPLFRHFIRTGIKRRSLEKIKASSRFGGDEEDRTLDLTDANRTLSQLSYAPMRCCDIYISVNCANCQEINATFFIFFFHPSFSILSALRMFHPRAGRLTAA